MKTLGEVRLNFNYKADICSLQTQFTAEREQNVVQSSSGVRPYSWVRVSGGSSNEVSPLYVGICHDDLYIRAFRNKDSSFYLPSFDGLKDQDKSIVNIQNCEENYRDLKVDSSTHADSVGKETQAEINSRTFNRGELISCMNMLANKKPDKNGTFKDHERRSFAYGCFVISEAVRFRAVRDNVQTLFDDDNATSRIRISSILKCAQNWEKLTKEGNLGSIVVPQSASDGEQDPEQQKTE